MGWWGLEELWGREFEKTLLVLKYRMPSKVMYMIS
jgi:hypothetical protein